MQTLTPAGLIHPCPRWACLVLVIAVASGCGSSSAATPASSAPTSTSTSASDDPPGEAAFTLVKPDGVVVPFSLAALAKLPLVSIMSDGQPQEGPALLSVLQSAGVTGFGSVTVTGSSGANTLIRAEVTEQVILDFNNRGKVKLVSPSWAKAQRVIDVTKIEVRA